MTIPCISLLLLTAVTSGYHLTYKYINNFQIASQVCSIRNNSSVKLYVVIPLLKTQSKSQSLDNAKPGPRVQFHPVSPGHPITHVRACVLLLQSCLTLCDPMDCSPPGSSVHGTLQATILEWVAMCCSRGSSQPRDRTGVFHLPVLAGRFFTTSGI